MCPRTTLECGLLEIRLCRPHNRVLGIQICQSKQQYEDLTLTLCCITDMHVLGAFTSLWAFPFPFSLCLVQPHIATKQPGQLE